MNVKERLLGKFNYFLNVTKFYISLKSLKDRIEIKATFYRKSTRNNSDQFGAAI